MLKLCCWNINGMRALLKRKDALNEYLNSFDILCFNETRISQQVYEESCSQQFGLYPHSFTNFN
jgi:exonuclease III